MSFEALNCSECSLAKPVQTITQYAKNLPATYSICSRMGVLVKPSKEHGCSVGVRKKAET